MAELLCAQAHLCIYFSKSGRGFGRFSEISPFVGLDSDPQTTLDGKLAATNAASTLKFSGPWAKPPRRKFDFREVFFVLFVTLIDLNIYHSIDF